MGLTILGPVSTTIPYQADVAVVYLKQSWADEWVFVPELRLTQMHVAAAGHGIGRAVVEGRYGTLKGVWETAFATRDPANVPGWWLRVVLVSELGTSVPFVGRIAGQRRAVHGSDTLPSGMQEWTAHDGRQELRRYDVSTSTWLVDGAEVEIGWCPGFNQRDQNGELVGNRSSSKGPTSGSYLFGGTDTWTRAQMLEYALRFAATADGPEWSFGGQLEGLKAATDYVPMGAAQSVDDVLRAIVDRSLGVDYVVRPTPDGFHVHVFALIPSDTSAGGATLPGNTDLVQVVAGEAVDSEVTLIESSTHLYDTIKVIGKREVICCTLRGADLEGKWSSAMETLYLAGAGETEDTGAAANDLVRRLDKFSSVFQSFGAPAAWDRAGAGTAPTFTRDGELEEQGSAFQLTRRRTLNWIPYRELDGTGESYPSGHQADLLPPQVYAYDEDEGRYFLIDHAGVGVRVLDQEWGVRLAPSMPHVLALNQSAGLNPSEVEGRFDYTKLVVTLAFEGDSRLELSVQAGQAGDGSVKVIHVPEAQRWYSAPGTITGVDGSGALVAAAEATVIRDDGELLALRLAGALARYGSPRARAEVRIKGLASMGGLVGQLLESVETEGDTQAIKGPITEVSWFAPRDGIGSTRLRGGYAFA